MKTWSFLKRNISALMTFSAGVIFLVIRIANPSIVQGNPADVLLVIALPLLVVSYTVLYKIEEQKELLEKLKGDILGVVPYKFTLFKNKTECDNYYKERMMRSQVIQDLTWAETNNKIESPRATATSLLDIIKNKDSVHEIFIFKIGNYYRQDRLLKLQTIYNFIKSGGAINYTCVYFEETSFERLQFTIFDEKEALFTSSYYPTRFSTSEQNLMAVLRKYFDQSCKEGITLISQGDIVNEAQIQMLLKNINS